MGGAQWAGKTTVAQALAERHGLALYAYDFHDARSHTERALADPARFPALAAERRPPMDYEPWVTSSAEELAAVARAAFRERFELVLDDLARLPPEPTPLVEGWGIRPELVAPLLDAPSRAIFLVPTEAWRRRQLRELPRAGRVSFAVSDPERAQRNRLARDRLLAEEVVESAARHGLRVLHVDGSLDAEAIGLQVGSHFAPHLPAPSSRERPDPSGRARRS